MFKPRAVRLHEKTPAFVFLHLAITLRPNCRLGLIVVVHILIESLLGDRIVNQFQHATMDPLLAHFVHIIERNRLSWLFIGKHRVNWLVWWRLCRELLLQLLQRERDDLILIAILGGEERDHGCFNWCHSERLGAVLEIQGEAH